MIKGVTGIHDVGGKIAPVALNDSMEIKKSNLSKIKILLKKMLMKCQTH